MFLIIGIILFLFAFACAVFKDIRGTLGAAVVCILLGICSIVVSCLIQVPAGHVKVATLFGQVKNQSYGSGLHFVNPLLIFTEFDVREKTHKESAGVPAEDKLITHMDVSVQYRTVGDMAAEILQNTGTTDALIQVHLIPKLRSILREQGKGVATSQDFFKESVQRQLQESLQAGLSEYLAPKGLLIETVLIRDVRLPDVIQNSITETKKREQEVLKQQAELQRFATEQDQKVKQAESELKAAKLEAQKIQALADAEAYKIEAINKTLAKSPNFELKRVEQWNGVLPVYSGGDATPMIDLR